MWQHFQTQALVWTTTQCGQLHCWAHRIKQFVYWQRPLQLKVLKRIHTVVQSALSSNCTILLPTTVTEESASPHSHLQIPHAWYLVPSAQSCSSTQCILYTYSRQTWNKWSLINQSVVVRSCLMTAVLVGVVVNGVVHLYKHAYIRTYILRCPFPPSVWSPSPTSMEASHWLVQGLWECSTWPTCRLHPTHSLGGVVPMAISGSCLPTCVTPLPVTACVHRCSTCVSNALGACAGVGRTILTHLYQTLTWEHSFVFIHGSFDLHTFSIHVLWQVSQMAISLCKPWTIKPSLVHDTLPSLPSLPSLPFCSSGQ